MDQVLDSLIHDALEDDISPLPIDPKVVQGIDQLEEYEEQQLKSVSNPDVQQVSKSQKENPGQASDQQRPLQPRKCDTCKKEFQFPLNLRRHEWKHRKKVQDKTVEKDIDQYEAYLEGVGDERVREIMSLKDAVMLLNTLTELQLNDIMKEVADKQNIDQEERLLLTFILGDAELRFVPLKTILETLCSLGKRGAACPPSQEIIKALCAVSEGQAFCDPLDSEMQKIVFPRDINMAKLREQGLLASFGYLVEYCTMKAWAQDWIGASTELRKEGWKYINEMPVKEEEETKNQPESTKKATKRSKQKRKHNQGRVPKEAKVSEKHTQEDSSKHEIEHDGFDASTSQPNPRESKENEEKTRDKQSLRSHEGPDNSGADAVNSNLVNSDAFTSQLNQESEKNMTDKENPKSREGPDSFNPAAAELNPVKFVISPQREHNSSDADASQLKPRESKESNKTDKESPRSGKGQDSSSAAAVQFNLTMLAGNVTTRTKWGDTDMDDINDLSKLDEEGSLRKAKESNKNTTDKESPRSHKGQNSLSAEAVQLNPVTLVGNVIERMKQGEADLGDDINAKFHKGGFLRRGPPEKSEDQCEWKPGRRAKARRSLHYQPQYHRVARHGFWGRVSYGGHAARNPQAYATCDSWGGRLYSAHGCQNHGGCGYQNQGSYDGHGSQGQGSKGTSLSAGEQNFPQGETTHSWPGMQLSASTRDLKSESFPPLGKKSNELNKGKASVWNKGKISEVSQLPAKGQTSIAVAKTPDGPKTARELSDNASTSGQTAGLKAPGGPEMAPLKSDGPKTPPVTIGDIDEEMKMLDIASGSQHIYVSHDFDRILSRDLCPKCYAHIRRLQEYEKHKTPLVTSGRAQEDVKVPDSALGSQNISHDLDKALQSYYEGLHQSFYASTNWITLADYEKSYDL